MHNPIEIKTIKNIISRGKYPIIPYPVETYVQVYYKKKINSKLC